MQHNYIDDDNIPLGILYLKYKYINESQNNKTQKKKPFIDGRILPLIQLPLIHIKDGNVEKKY
jgi:hypothetical protein